MMPFGTSGILRRPALLLALSVSLLLSGCASAPQYENAAFTAADVRRMPQSLEVLAGSCAEAGLLDAAGLAGADTLLRSPSAARADMARFREKFFEPWDALSASPEAVLWLRRELEREPSRRGYAENMHPWSDRAWQKMVDNAALDALADPSFLRRRPLPAITIRPTDLRAAPTMRPRFSQVHGAGRGWPFDLFQQSRLHAGAPLAVYHKSLDGAWLLVQSDSAWGWLRAEDAAAAGEAFRKLWRKRPLCAFVREGVGLKFKALGADAAKGPEIRQGSYLATADIGTVLPAGRTGEVLLPMRGLDGAAYAVTASFSEYSASPASPHRADPLSAPAVRMPLSLTADAAARIGDRMMGQPYGWGGLYGDRDCSATMRDLFAPFGIWLPRNSGAQAQEGEAVSLEGLSAGDKEKALRERARPFRTLIAMPGHIGLYVGQWQGRAAMFHNMWGVRNTLDDGRDGRLVVGRAAVTSLRPGAERGDVDEERLLIERVKAFTILGSGKIKP